MSRLLGNSAYKVAREQTRQKLTPMKSAIITSVIKDASSNTTTSQGNKIRETNSNHVIVRATWVNKKNVRTVLNAGTEAFSLDTISGSLKPEKWADSLGLLLSAFGINGSGTLSFALFEYDLIKTGKNDMDSDSGRLSPWLNVPAEFK